MTSFAKIPLAPSDPIFGIVAAFHSDPRPEKINLSIGIYQTEDQKTPVLEAVKDIEKIILEHETDKKYLPIDGDGAYIEQVGRLCFSHALWDKLRERTCGLQTIGGTSALRLGADLLRAEVSTEVYLPDPTWPNHTTVFSKAHYTVHSYPYYDIQKHEISFDKFYHTLEQMKPNTVVLLHAACHNPSGADLSHEQWRLISQLMLERKLIPFFDMAYQGFGDGVEEDAYAVRYFAEKGHEMLVATSFSKSFSLYGERVGALYAVCHDKSTCDHVRSQLKRGVRGIYSNPPLHGEKIVVGILTSHELHEKWLLELKEMRERIDEMRRSFAHALSRACNKNFDFLLSRKGMFTFTGLSKKQVMTLKEKYAIYMTDDGRINLASLNRGNIDRVVQSIASIW